VTGQARGYVLAVSFEPLDASTTLFFGHLAGQRPDAVRVARFGHPELARAVAGASAIVLVRGLFEFASVIWSARVLRIPLYYFVDDNFMQLREQPGAWSAFVGRYSATNVRRRLRAFCGVMLSTRELIEYFRMKHLHQRLILFPPIESGTPVPRSIAARHSVCVAFFGGLHLHDSFDRYVLPAIRRLAAARPVTLIAAGMNRPIAPSPGLTIVDQRYDSSYERGLRRLADAGVDVLVHPSADLLNDRYKNPHALISAKAIGAIPIVSNRPPYGELQSAGVARLCDDSPESWYAALAQTTQPGERSGITERLAVFCASHFGGELNRQAIDEMLSRHPPPSTRWGFAKRGAVRAFLLLGRLRAARVRQMSTAKAESSDR
jgi:hypothetical protein